MKQVLTEPEIHRQEFWSPRNTLGGQAESLLIQRMWRHRRHKT